VFWRKRVRKFNITLDSASIYDSTRIYSEDTLGSQVTAEIRFCVRFELKTIGPTAVEVNLLETLITLNADLTDGFEIGSIAVEPKDKLVHTANQVYQVVGFRCDANDALISNLTPINQRIVVRVCVGPDAEATADGIKMHSIDLFTGSRAMKLWLWRRRSTATCNTNSASYSERCCCAYSSQQKDYSEGFDGTGSSGEPHG
jgi:hypothetical protein